MMQHKTDLETLNTSICGALVPDFPFTGTVQAVYSKAIAVLNDAGMLISLVGKSEHMEAFAVNLGSGFEEARMNLKEGMKITVGAKLDCSAYPAQGGELDCSVYPAEGKLYGTANRPAGELDGSAYPAQGGELDCSSYPAEGKLDGTAIRPTGKLDCSVYLPTAPERWDPRPLLAGVRKELSSADESTLEYICDTIEHIMRSVSRGDFEHAALSKEGIRGEGAFAQRFSVLEKSPEFPANVVGFGPGTTPSGDDFIAGFLCARLLLEKTESVKTQNIKKMVRENLGRTSLQGRTLLLGLVEDIPPFYLVNIALALASDSSGEDDEEALIDAVLAALDHGASSGEDALWGFLSGFCAKDF